MTPGWEVHRVGTLSLIYEFDAFEMIGTRAQAAPLSHLVNMPCNVASGAQDEGFTMAMKFRGSYEELVHILQNHGVRGSWEAKPDGVVMLRCRNGANLHWAKGSKSLWFSGKPAASELLGRKLEDMLSRPRPSDKCRDDARDHGPDRGAGDWLRSLDW